MWYAVPKEVNDMRKWILILLLILLAAPAFAEDIPVLPGYGVLENLPEDTFFTVHTGPGGEYHVAAKGRAKVSTGGPIQYYGRVGDTGWVMIRYEVSQTQIRVGYIDLRDHPDAWRGKREVAFGSQRLLLAGRVDITDDPYRSGSPIGAIDGAVTLLAWRGSEWAYVEGSLNNNPENLVRGFIPRSALNGTGTAPDLPVSVSAGDHYTLKSSADLTLQKGATAEGLEVFRLTDGSLLITYRCTGSDKVFLRVISEAGKKLWAKSVDRRYLHQITVTKTGFICETFDNSECDSGMRYTYTRKGNKWAAKSVAWINEPDRAYADNTASFTLLRHTFREGGQSIPIELTNRVTGATLLSDTHTFKPFLYEADGSLLLLDEAADGTLTLRIFSADLAEVASVPAPAALADRWVILVRTACHNRTSVYFFTHAQGSWHLWRFDRATLTFDEAPVAVNVPEGCTLTALNGSAVLLQTAFGSYLCELRDDGQLLLDQALPGKVLWTAPGGSGVLFLIQNAEGEFLLLDYSVSVG